MFELKIIAENDKWMIEEFKRDNEHLESEK
jgi:hypothetical protein